MAHFDLLTRQILADTQDRLTVPKNKVIQIRLINDGCCHGHDPRTKRANCHITRSVVACGLGHEDTVLHSPQQCQLEGVQECDLTLNHWSCP